MSESALRECVKYALSKGYQIDGEAFNLLKEFSKFKDPISMIDEALQWLRKNDEKSFIISKDVLEKILTSLIEDVQKKKITSLEPLYSKTIESRIQILNDPSTKIKTSSSLESYINYFVSRFKKLRKILRSRADVREVIQISQIPRLPINHKAKLIGMVSEKREHKGSIYITVEDLSGQVRLGVFSSSDRELIDKVRNLMLDQVVCIEFEKYSERILRIEDVIFPDIPNKKVKRSDEDVWVALVSDLHIGSRNFMREEFENFILWLSGKYDSALTQEISGRVKYLLIAGDLVDGIGIYPNQEEELEILDIVEQYDLAAELLAHIPEWIDIVIIPGNHDASRKALPQPAIPRKYAGKLYNLRNVHCFGNPCYLSLHGIEVLMFHGRSLDDVISSIPNFSFDTPELAMKLLLQARHLAPIYGQRTPIAPEEEDYLIIDKVPEIFHAGHVHVSKHTTYRGTHIVNSGTWQKQTKFQRMMGLSPTPGIITLLNLKTFQTVTLDFKEI